MDKAGILERYKALIRGDGENRRFLFRWEIRTMRREGDTPGIYFHANRNLNHVQCLAPDYEFDSALQKDVVYCAAMLIETLNPPGKPRVFLCTQQLNRSTVACSKSHVSSIQLQAIHQYGKCRLGNLLGLPADQGSWHT